MIKNYRNGEQIGGCEGLETALEVGKDKDKVGYSYKKDSTRDPCCAGTVLYLGCGGGDMNLHRGQTEVTHTKYK